MRALREMTVRELIMALSHVEDAVRRARRPELPAPAHAAAGDEVVIRSLAMLAADERRIVEELRPRSAEGAASPVA